MKIVVDNRDEAIWLAGKFVSLCNDIRISGMDDILQMSYESFLCSLRDAIVLSNIKE